MSERFTLVQNPPVKFWCAKCRTHHDSNVSIAFEEYGASYWCERCVKNEMQTPIERMRETINNIAAAVATADADKGAPTIILPANAGEGTPKVKLSRAERRAMRKNRKPRLVFSSSKALVKEPEELTLVL